MDRLASYSCPICGNTDIQSIGYLNGKPYCRRCISFKGEEVGHKPSYPKKAPIHLSYELSPEQKELSEKLVKNYKKGIDSLVFAVCGSGKTEICLKLIQYAVNCGDRVAFAIPRKDVAIELHNRLKSIFKFNVVTLLYGGHTKKIDGDIIVLTTHQLYRFKNYFQLIILDEIDAFPFKDDKVLESMFYSALDGHYVMMSATPSQDIVNHFKQNSKDILRLDVRFHRFPLPIPIIKKHCYLTQLLISISLLKKYIANHKRVFVFTPTIESCEKAFRFISIFVANGNYVHSKRDSRKEIINTFKNGLYDYLITTSVLERGVTVKGLQVVVLNADSGIFDSGTLIQIAGRAGRKKEDPVGEVVFLTSIITKEIIEAIDSIKQSNKALED